MNQSLSEADLSFQETNTQQTQQPNIVFIDSKSNVFQQTQNNNNNNNENNNQTLHGILTERQSFSLTPIPLNSTFKMRDHRARQIVEKIQPTSNVKKKEKKRKET